MGWDGVDDRVTESRLNPNPPLLTVQMVRFTKLIADRLKGEEFILINLI